MGGSSWWHRSAVLLIAAVAVSSCAAASSPTDRATKAALDESTTLPSEASSTTVASSAAQRRADGLLVPTDLLGDAWTTAPSLIGEGALAQLGACGSAPVSLATSVGPVFVQVDDTPEAGQRIVVMSRVFASPADAEKRVTGLQTEEATVCVATAMRSTIGDPAAEGELSQVAYPTPAEQTAAMVGTLVAGQGDLARVTNGVTLVAVRRGEVTTELLSVASGEPPDAAAFSQVLAASIELQGER